MDGAHPVGDIPAGSAIIAVVAEAVFLAWFSGSRVCSVHSMEALSSSCRNKGRILGRFRQVQLALFGGIVAIGLFSSKINRPSEAQWFQGIEKGVDMDDY